MYKEIIEKIQKSEDESTYSKEQVFEIITQMLLKKCEENKNNVDIEDLRKNWRKGVANLVGVLGLAHGAHYMTDMPGPKSEREKSPTYQRIQQQMEAKKNIKRTPSSMSPIDSKIDPVKQAYEQARQEGQAIIDRNYDNSRDKKIDDFLHNVSGVESSFGKNTKHKQIKQGIHAGDSAVGQYGLMPNTIKEMATRMGKDSPMSIYSKMDNKAIADSIKKNPQHQKEIAKFMANHLYDKFGGDENKMAFAYNQGHNIDVNDKKFTSGEYKNHDYVKKYNKNKLLTNNTK